MMHILHITPWFPETNDPHHGIFISRHVASLERTEVKQTVIHLAIHFPGEKKHSYTDGHVMHIHRTIPVRSWRVAEWIFAFTLRQKLRQLNAAGNFTHVCFHIAYPALAQLQVFENLLPEKKLIVEHWSAYHFNFNSDKKPHRLKSLFSHGIRLATVSRRLGNDIKSFCEKDISFDVLPNVVDTSIFCIPTEEKTTPKQDGEIRLMMHAFWKEPKRPFEIFKELLSAETGRYKLVITGSGPLWTPMKDFVLKNNLTHKIQFTEQAGSAEIAALMRNADVFLMPTGYETFSVVTAEALCCGCPVVASDVGALPELIHDGNGLLKVSSASWLNTIELLLEKKLCRSEIAHDASIKYSKQIVGEQFFQILQSL